MPTGVPSALLNQRRLQIPSRAEAVRRPLGTTRLIVEPIESSAYRNFWSAVQESRPSLTPWLPWVPLNDSLDASFRYTEACERDWEHGTALRYFVRLRNTSPIIGVVSLENCQKQHLSCELGYWLHPNHQGQGLMTEAVDAVLRFAFLDLGAHRIRCAAGQDNSRSQKMAQRLGFSKEGIARDAEYVDGRWVTHVVYSLLRTDDSAKPFREPRAMGS